MKDDGDKVTDNKTEKCDHRNAEVMREGMTKLVGVVICPDCGLRREWNAY
jgi:hypothetical protein